MEIVFITGLRNWYSQSRKVVRGMALESYYLEQAGKQQAAQLRFDQACALAAAYGIEAPAAGEIPVMNDFDEMLEADGIAGEE